MAAPKRTNGELERDRVEIARLYCQGLPQVEIAARIGMTRQMVGYDIKVIQKRWLGSQLVDFDSRKSEELAKIDNLERTYWEAWERSTQVRESSNSRIMTSPSGQESQETSVKQEQMVGDARFLQGIQWCIDKRCKIFGLDAPIKIDWREELPEGYDADQVQAEFVALMTLAAEDYDSTD